MHSTNLLYKAALSLTTGIKAIGANFRPHRLLCFLTQGKRRHQSCLTNTT